MHGEDGTLHLSMAQELLIRELDEPLQVVAPPWADRNGDRGRDHDHVAPTGGSDGSA
jgi:hypothetical protein